MSGTVNLRLTPAGHKAAKPNSATRCLLATELNRQLGGQWIATAGGAEQIGTGRRLRLGANAKQAMIRFDVTGTSAARRRPVTVTLHERGKRSRQGAAVRGAAGGGALLMAAMGDLWWIPAVAVAIIAVPVFIALVMNKVSVPRVTRPSAAPPASARPRWPDGPGWSPQRGRGTGDGQ